MKDIFVYRFSVYIFPLLIYRLLIYFSLSFPDFFVKVIDEFFFEIDLEFQSKEPIL